MKSPDGKERSRARSYSRFIRWMRIVLPLIAIGIIGLLMAWPRVNETFEAIPKEMGLPLAIGKNELIKPRFESEDSKGQPFTVTAVRALQNSTDPDEVLLEQPKAHLTLNDNTGLSAQADQGTYSQNSEKLLLDGHVKLFHDQGYEMNTEKLLVDIRKNSAWSDHPISGHGPAGTLEATGMQAQTDTGRLIFTGPAKLVLHREIKGQDKQDIKERPE